MEELDRAYDAIVAERRGQTAYTSGQSSYTNAGNGGYNAYGGSAYSGSQFADVRAQINSGRIDDAEMILDGIPIGSRTAEWYFLKGQIQQRRGWFDEAYKKLFRRLPARPGQYRVRGGVQFAEQQFARRLSPDPRAAGATPATSVRRFVCGLLL